jgi:hypothetical protein
MRARASDHRKRNRAAPPARPNITTEEEKPDNVLLGRPPMAMPGFLQSAKGQVTFLIVAIIAVVFLSMLLHLL